MLNDVGYIMLTAALAVSVYAAAVPHLGVRRNNWNLVRSAQVATVLNLVFVSLAVLVMMRAFLANDFINGSQFFGRFTRQFF